MLINIFKFLLLFALIGVSGEVTYAQIDASTASGRPDPSKKESLPDGIKETLAKGRIKAEEKEYRELLERGEEAVKISEEIAKNFETTNKLTVEDAKKLERLEKVIKKIRQDLGAKDDDKIDEDAQAEVKPSSLVNALSNIKDKTSDLLSELKKTTRHSISVVAVQSSNALLKLVRFVKFSRN